MNPGDTCTPIYGLPYATGASRPCDVGSTMCDFAEAVEGQLDLLDGTAAQLAATPFAYIVSSVEQTYDNTQPTPFVPTFDTTLADTDNMVDLSFDPTALYIRTPGVYSFFAEMDVLIAATGTSLTAQPLIKDATGSQIGGNFAFQTFRFSAPASMPVKVNGAALANVCWTAEFIVDVGAGYSYSFTASVGGAIGTISTFQAYRAGAVWLRERL